MPPTLDHPAARDHDGVDVRRGGRERHLRRQAARGPDRVQPYRDEIREPTRCDPAGVRPAQAGVAGRTERLDQGRRGEGASPAGAQPPACISSPRASSSRSVTACWSLPSEIGEPASRSSVAGPMPSARSRSVVGHKQAQVRLSPSNRMSPAVRWVACTAVV